MTRFLIFFPSYNYPLTTIHYPLLFPPPSRDHQLTAVSDRTHNDDRPGSVGSWMLLASIIFDMNSSCVFGIRSSVALNSFRAFGNLNVEGHPFLG